MKRANIEVTTLHEAMPWFRGNQTAAAEHLAVNRGSLRNYLITGRAKDLLLQVQRDPVTGVINGFTMINRHNKGADNGILGN